MKGTLTKMFLIDIDSKIRSKQLRIFIQALLMLMLTLLIYRYTYNHDWKRWISFFCILLVFKMIMDISTNSANIILKTNYSFSDSVTDKKFGNLVGVLMIMLITFQIIGFRSFDSFIERQLQFKGIPTTTYVKRIFWHEGSKLKYTGYKLEYYYKVGKTEYHHNLFLGRKYEFEEVKIKYLPMLPDKHSIVVK